MNRIVHRIFLVFPLVAGLVFFGAVPAFSRPVQEHEGHKHGKMSVDEHLQMLTSKLNLTAEQQDKIKPILEDQHKKIEELHNNSSLSHDERMTKKQQIHQETSSQVRALLTDEQQKKFDAMQKEHSGHMNHKKGEGSRPGR